MLALWFMFVVLAILNGTVRNFLYAPYVGELLAHQISTLILSVLFVIVGYLYLGKTAVKTDDRVLLKGGALILLMTVLFEFGFGHYVMGNSWEKLFADYNLFAGRIWLVVLITILFMPLIVKRLKARSFS